jgi:hypothetical protein
MTAYLQTVLNRPVPGAEDQFNHWYDHTHLPEVLATPGFLAARRYTPTDPAGPYLAIYEIETDDLGAVLEDLRARARTMTVSESLDAKSIVMDVFQAMGPHRGCDAESSR